MQFPTRSVEAGYESSGGWSSSSNDEHDSSTGKAPPLDLTQVYDRVRECIVELGGSVFPKLQWSCPKDAAWMIPNNTIQCCTPDDVFLLLKSSDRASYDVDMLQNIIREGSPRSPLRESVELPDKSSDEEEGSSEEGTSRDPIAHRSHVLALRKWYSLKPGREFRCFVRDNELTGMLPL